MTFTAFEGITLTQQKALAICPKVGALLSMGGTVYIFLKIFASNRLNRPNRPEVVYNRLLLGLTIGDFAYALVAFLSTWPVPKDTIYRDYIWGEAGNQTTCDIQGFFSLWASLMAIVYMSSLSLYFLLIIRYKWALERLQKIEPYMHGLAWIFASTASVICVSKDLTNPFIVGCGVQSYPLKCNSSKGVPCIRGENAVIYQWILVITPTVVGLIFVSACMIMMYATVRTRQSAAARFRRDGDTSETVDEQISEDFRRAWQFTGVYIFLSMPPLIAIFTFAISGKESFIIAMLRAIIAPMQGFFNAIVFSRDVEGELIRSIWDASYRTRARTPAAQRRETSQLSSSNLARNQSISQKNTSASENKNIGNSFVNVSE
eukprot:CAMPEP_0172416678 /NCGR_PEP_ID=MMETSP1064-20121228/3181_1 /TAXON_ID=202472 /ORGANISM="Aulacoseira subarctica , Strain CCAP 1002/5" /LENGTH=374 /DNA_ID=CAMNT_0013154513 /DNA_START=16 /DNA_END=1140 /DNA_ORIENTATION=-